MTCLDQVEKKWNSIHNRVCVCVCVCVDSNVHPSIHAWYLSCGKYVFDFFMAMKWSFRFVNVKICQCMNPVLICQQSNRFRLYLPK